MKISPIKSINIAKIQKRNIVSFVDNSSVQNSKQIDSLTNNYYYPISFSAKPKSRVYSSQHPELFEHPGDFQLSKIDDIPCPACG